MPTFDDLSIHLRCTLVACALIGGGPLHAQSAAEPAQVLPRLEVAGNVPLVKVGDFKMLEARFAPAVVAEGDYLYTIGGQDTGRNAIGSIERFNVRTGQSEPFAKLKVARYWHRAVIAGGKIYVLGGFNGQSMGLHEGSAPPDGDLLAGRRAASGSAGPGSEMAASIAVESSVEIIDLATRQVTTGVPMPEARTQFAAALLDGKIYVLGGKRVGKRNLALTNDVQVFDLARGKWSKGVAMPVALSSMATVVAPGVIVVAGGFDGEQPHTDVSVFNPADKLWRTLPPLHRKVSSHSLVFLGHHLFLFGDYYSPGELVAYDLVTKKSESFTLNYKKARHTDAVVLDNKIYVVGGRLVTDTESVDYVQAYALTGKK